MASATLNQDGQTAARGSTLTGTYAGGTPTQGDVFINSNSFTLTSFVASAGNWSGVIDSLTDLGDATVNITFPGPVVVAAGDITVTAAATGQGASKLSMGLSLGL